MGSTNSALSGLPVPDTAANNDVPYWLSQLVAALDARIVLTATSVSDRDSKFFSAPSGVLCVVRGAATPFAISGVYIKTSDTGTSVWSPVWTAPVTPTPVTIPLADGFASTNGKTPQAVYNAAANTWALWGNIAPVNGSTIGGSSTILGTIPAAVAVATYQPYYEGIAPISIGGTGGPTGGAKVQVAASGTITVFMPTGVATNWVGLDGIVLPGA